MGRFGAASSAALADAANAASSAGLRMSTGIVGIRIEASITMDDGKVVTKELVLDQASGFQQRDFRFHDVRTVRFTLETAYNTSDKKQVAIAEIEFFGPSQGGNA